MNTNPSAKRILCFGDCNVYGYIPISEKRYPVNVRWPGKLQDILGVSFEVIEEGLTRRNSGFHDPDYNGMNSLEYIEPCLLSHLPLDWVVLWIGTRDHKDKFSIDPVATTINLQKIIKLIKKIAGNDKLPPKILLICPTLVTSDIKRFSNRYNTAIEKSQEMRQLLKELSAVENVEYLDAASITKPSKRDGMHLEPEGHAAVASAVGKVILNNN